MPRSHYRTDQIALRLLHHISPAVVAALDLYQSKRNTALKARGETDGRGIGDNSPTEAATLEAERWDTKVEEIIDTIESLEISAGHLAKLTIGIDRTPAAADVLRCKDGQVGKDAVLWSSNTECAELPVKRDLCEAHYRAWLRHLKAKGRSVLQYYEDAR